MIAGPRGVWRWWLLGLAGSALLTACQFEERPPSGSRQEDESAHVAIVAFYEALATRDTSALRYHTFGSGSALLDVTGEDVTLVPIGALVTVPERRTTGAVPRIARTELRLDGSMATARVVLVAIAGDGVAEMEATDLLTLGRREGQWRVAHSQLGPWRTRSAP